MLRGTASAAEPIDSLVEEIYWTGTFERNLNNHAKNAGKYGLFLEMRAVSSDSIVILLLKHGRYRLMYCENVLSRLHGR